MYPQQSHQQAGPPSALTPRRPIDELQATTPVLRNLLMRLTGTSASKFTSLLGLPAPAAALPDAAIPASTPPARPPSQRETSLLTPLRTPPAAAAFNHSQLPPLYLPQHILPYQHPAQPRPSARQSAGSSGSVPYTTRVTSTHTVTQQPSRNMSVKAPVSISTGLKHSMSVSSSTGQARAADDMSPAVTASQQQPSHSLGAGVTGLRVSHVADNEAISNGSLGVAEEGHGECRPAAGLSFAPDPSGNQEVGGAILPAVAIGQSPQGGSPFAGASPGSSPWAHVAITSGLLIEADELPAAPSPLQATGPHHSLQAAGEGGALWQGAGRKRKRLEECSTGSPSHAQDTAQASTGQASTEVALHLQQHQEVAALWLLPSSAAQYVSASGLAGSAHQAWLPPEAAVSRPDPRASANSLTSKREVGMLAMPGQPPSPESPPRPSVGPAAVTQQPASHTACDTSHPRPSSSSLLWHS
ncbi:hypothetical protein V8C86DRAFT_2470556, partial [Haematococcus lacustris]